MRHDSQLITKLAERDQALYKIIATSIRERNLIRPELTLLRSGASESEALARLKEKGITV